MTGKRSPFETVVIGGGMITRMQILPSLYELQREGLVGTLSVCALNGAPLGTVEGADFAAALFAIWLGPKAIDESLKAQLLGRS